MEGQGSGCVPSWIINHTTSTLSYQHHSSYPIKI